MNSALLLLLVAVPLLASALSVLITSRTFDRLLLLAVPVFVGGSGIGLLGLHGSTPVIAHSVGDYVPGLAIVFVSDTFTALMLVLTSLVAFVSSLFPHLHRRGSVPVRSGAHHDDAHRSLWCAADR